MTPASVDRYRDQDILTASPCQLVVKLYDKAIGALTLAQDAVQRRDIKSRHTANQRALDVITHLTNTLDMERGGEIARNLRRLYGFMCVRLIDVDLNNDAQAAGDVIGLLKPLRQSWQQLDRQVAVPQTHSDRPAVTVPLPSAIPPSADTARHPRVVASV
ncbi:MAG: flagellar export chaperone FliS [Alphaproteobacteria bacterium]